MLAVVAVKWDEMPKGRKDDDDWDDQE